MPLQTFKRWLLVPTAALLILLLSFAALLQFYIFPNINDYKPRIISALSEGLKQEVSIAQLGIRWHNLTPEATLHALVLYDSQHRPALQLKQVDAALSWSSLLLLSPQLSKLSIESPELVIRRTPTGEIFLAGISVVGSGEPTFVNWLIAQRRIQIRHANVQWIDEQRQAPTLSFNDLNLTLEMPLFERLLGRHHVHLETELIERNHQRISLDATLIGHDLANFSAWHGEARINMPRTNLSLWQPWLDLPLHLQQGQGNINASIAFAHNQILKFSSQVDLSHLVATIPEHSLPFEAEFLRGNIEWEQWREGGKLTFQHVSTDIRPSLQLHEGNGKITWQGSHLQGSVNAEKLALSNSAALSDWLPADSKLSSMVQGIAPQVLASKIKLSAEQKNNVWVNYSVDADFEQLNSRAYDQLPGVEGWRGHIHLRPNQGNLILNTENASVDSAGVFRWPIAINQLRGKVNWLNNGSKILVSVRDLLIENPHLGLRLNLEYLINPNEGDHIQLQGNVRHGSIKQASRFYPTMMSSESRQWLESALLEGNINRAEVIVRGKVKDFPFVNAAQHADPKLGLFRVSAQLDHVLMEYGVGWPPVNDLAAHLKFEGKQMNIDAVSGNTLGHQIVYVHAEIPQLDADNPILNLHGQVKGTVDQGLRFVNSSPVKRLTQGFTDHLKAGGAAELQLDLQVPLEDVNSTRVNGDYLIKNGHLEADASMGLPELIKLNGHLKFTEKGIFIPAMQADLFESPANFSLTTRADKAIVIEGSGRISDTAIRKLDNNLVTAALHGNTDWKASLLIQKQNLQLNVKSQLVGMNINLPAPLNKSADSPVNLLVSINQEDNQHDTFELEYDDGVHAKFLRRRDGTMLRIQSGEIAVNSPIASPSGDGIHLQANLIKLNMDDWLEYLKKNITENGISDNSAGLSIRAMDISAETLTFFDRNLHHMKAHILPLDDRLKLTIQGQELAGDADWLQGKQNKLVAKLNYLHIPMHNQATENKTQIEIRRQSSLYPELEISAQEFQLGQKNLGALDLKANNSGDNWIIQHLSLSSADTQLMADGVWRNSVRNPNTQLKFSLNTNNLGKTLQRFQPAELIKGGSGNISGQISWPGSPHELAINQLDGNFKLQLESGQILKVQPGAGRLLGLLSLQSLPRRLTLDFRDLFSEGFAFDKIQCTANMNDGILYSQDFFMTGPAAEANISGETNLKTETQLLKVKVSPHVSDTLSLAALAGGPVIGVAAFVAQKLLKDPFNKISASEYMIGGTWENPQEIETDKSITRTGSGTKK